MPDRDTDTAVHPEDFCQTCGRRNPAWWTDSPGWNVATENVPLGRAAILCPSCFVTAWEAATGDSAVWQLVYAHRSTRRSPMPDGDSRRLNGDSAGPQSEFDRDVEAAHRYFAEHEEPDDGWTPAHLMHGAKRPDFGECEGDPVYARQIWKAALDA